MPFLGDMLVSWRVNREVSNLVTSMIFHVFLFGAAFLELWCLDVRMKNPCQGPNRKGMNLGKQNSTEQIGASLSVD